MSIILLMVKSLITISLVALTVLAVEAWKLVPRLRKRINVRSFISFK